MKTAFEDTLLEHVVAVPSIQEIYQTDIDRREVVVKEANQILPQESCIALGQCYIVINSKVQEITYVGFDNLHTCIGIALMHQFSGKIVVAHISDAVLVPNALLKLFKEFNNELKLGRSFELRLVGGVLKTHHDDAENTSINILKRILFFLLILIQQHNLTINLLSSDILNKLDEYRNSRKQEDILGVGQLFDKDGRVVFLQGSQVEGPQPFTDRSSTIFLNEDKKNKIWLMLLVALEIETNDIIKIYDSTKKAWNKKFLKFCEKKFKSALIIKIMLELEKNQLTAFPEIDDPFTRALVKANIHELLNCEVEINFTDQFLKYTTYIEYKKYYSDHPLPLSANEIQDLFINKIPLIQEKIFNTIFIRFADLLHGLLALSRIEKSKEQIIALMLNHQVSVWHLYDAIRSYQLAQQTSSQSGSSSHSDHFIGRLLTYPSYMEDEIRLWQKQTLTRELENIARNIVGDHKKRSNMLIAIFPMKGKSLLPLVHSHSPVYPLLEQLISKLRDILNNKVEKKEIENLINAWYDTASSSLRSAVNLASSEKSETIKPNKFL